MITERTWYRMAGRNDTGAPAPLFPRRDDPKYHAESDDWIRSGRALCGADIGNAAYAWHPSGGAPPALNSCAACRAAVAKEVAS